ncbi:hypothetical protein [Hyphobacterium sp.]|uniref:hypothetical protein n=1 Tax=Hyphobacterium sp. TaxID=2004662 RepID=UPI00374835A0
MLFLPVNDRRLRNKFEELSRRMDRGLDSEVVERAGFVWRAKIGLFDVAVGCDIDRGASTDCVLSYIGPAGRPDVLDLFFIDTISEILNVSIPPIEWRSDGKQIRKPIVRMKVVFAAVSEFARLARIDSEALATKIESVLELS